MSESVVTIKGLHGTPTQVTVWRRLRRVVMRYGAGRVSVHRNVTWPLMNDLECDLAAAGYGIGLHNTCRTTWSVK